MIRVKKKETDKRQLLTGRTHTQYKNFKSETVTQRNLKNLMGSKDYQQL